MAAISPKKRRRSRQASLKCLSPFIIGFVTLFIGAWMGWAISLLVSSRNGGDGKVTGNAAAPRQLEQDGGGGDGGDIDIWRELTTHLTWDRLEGIAGRLAEDYKEASPFPHAIIDDLFPQTVLDALLEENPESIVGPNGCYPKHQQCNKATEKDRQYLKSSIPEEEDLGPNTRAVIMFMKSGVFIQFLKKLSGITGLLADPVLNGAGIHLTAPGGKLDLHADFNAYVGPRLDRRVNAFLFLNNDWKEEFGGHLELWSRDMKSCGQRIFPALGRFVVFSTSDFSHHGHPRPLTAPPGRLRRSLALYYYTVGRPPSECLDMKCPVFGVRDGWHTGHTTLWKEPVGCTDCLDPSCNALPQ